MRTSIVSSRRIDDHSMRPTDRAGACSLKNVRPVFSSGICASTGCRGQSDDRFVPLGIEGALAIKAVAFASRFEAMSGRLHIAIALLCLPMFLTVIAAILSGGQPA